MFEPGIHPAVTRLVPTKESTNISDILNSFAFPPVPASHFKPSTVLAMDSAAAAVPSEGHSSRIRRPVFGHPRQPRKALKTLSRPGVDRSGVLTRPGVGEGPLLLSHQRVGRRAPPDCPRPACRRLPPDCPTQPVGA